MHRSVNDPKRQSPYDLQRKKDEGKEMTDKWEDGNYVLHPEINYEPSLTDELLKSRQSSEALLARIHELEAEVAELQAAVKGHDPFEEYPPKQHGFECSVVVLGKFEYEDEFTPITNWDLCVYWFDDERWHPLNGYVAGDDIVRWYALPLEAQK